MEKFYWEPNREEKIGIVAGIFEPDGLSRSEIEQLVDTFVNQPIDFFKALRARIYDEQIREFIYQVGLENVSSRVVNSVEGPPIFPKQNFSLSRLIEFGKLLGAKQQRVQEMRLAREYNQVLRGQHTEPAKSNNNGNSAANVSASNGKNLLSAEIQKQVQQLLDSGYKIGVEYVDERRFCTNSWNSCAIITANSFSEASAALENC